ncbi:MAG: cyclic nucleotide-binding domain-containing protein [Anaerolineales bacterium]|nr:cyclic nucleotide-binding domain-containing protein [Anaerolineales bacterium]
MDTGLAERLALLKDMALFQELEEAQLAAIAARLQEYALPANRLLYLAGDRAENFYILVGGRLLNQDIEDGQRVGEYVLEPGDPFGAEALLDQEARQAAVSALHTSRLLYLTGEDFAWMLAEFPQVYEGLQHLLNGRKLLGRVHFDFLQEDEVVHYATRKHPSTLWLRWTRALLLAIFGLLVLYLGQSVGAGLQFTMGLAAATLLFGSAAAVGWEALDWRNDFVLITNLRVVWMEHRLLRSASRVEAPLSTIQSVDVHTHLFARLLGFGDIIVRTYTGIVLMPGVGAPLRTKYLIRDFAARSRKLSRQARHDTIRLAVRQSLGIEKSLPASTHASPAMPLVDQSERFSLFKSRTVDGDKIVYHKHWFSLLSSLALPGLFVIAVLVGAPIVFDGLPRNALGWLLTLAALLAPLAIIAYRLLDWVNDVYVVTSEVLIDTERKPLGSEITKSAPIANILSLQNHKVGIIGLLLNFGVVRISVGDSVLDFDNVPNPAQVQQDIFARMEALRARQQTQQTEDERRRMTEWLRVYEEERGRNPQTFTGDEAAVE